MINGFKYCSLHPFSIRNKNSQYIADKQNKLYQLIIKSLPLFKQMPVMTKLPNDLPWSSKAELPQVTFRSTLAGLAIGSIILMSNFQFGLQTGWVSMMSLPSALLGFSIFKTLQSHLDIPFTDVENVFVQSVSVAVATGPLSYGFVGIIPAIEKLMTDEESGYINGIDLKPIWKLIVWSLGLAFFGVFFAIPLRKQFIIKEKLPFPSGSATATLISVFHGTSINIDNEGSNDENNDSNNNNATHKKIELNDNNDISRNPVETDTTSSSTSFTENENTGTAIPELSNNPNNLTIIESQDLCRLEQIESYQTNIKLLTITSSISSAYTIISYFIPQIKTLPLFGSFLSNEYLLNFQPSPAYMGQGIIMGLATTSYMMFGMILGWCVLCPLAKNIGWAPGKVDDWIEGGEGWIMWISLSIMISDSIVSLVVLTVKGIIASYKAYKVESGVEVANPSTRYNDHSDLRRLINDDNDVPSDEDVTSSTFHGEEDENVERIQVSDDLDTLSNASKCNDVDDKYQVSNKFTVIGLVVSSLMCIVTTRIVFGPIVPLYSIAVAIFLSLILSVLGVKALGQTDLNPVSGIGKLSQLIFALIIPKNQPGAILINLISGAISEAATQQAGDLLQDLKTGYLLGASPKAQFAAQMYGSVFSIGLSAVMYKVYNSLYEIPGRVFKIPTAVIWIDCARLVNGSGLPPYAYEFSIFFGLLFGVISLLKNTISSDHKWFKYLIYMPGGVPVGIGIYNTPSFTLARFIGGVISYYWMKKVTSTKVAGGTGGSDEKVKLIIFSSGLVLGEGLFSVFNMLLTSFGVPHL